MKSSKKEFIVEAEELLEESHSLALEIQDTFTTALNPDSVNALFRSIHTLKGLSGIFGHQGISDMSHSLETILDDIRLGRIEVADDVLEFLFENLDIIKSLIEGVVSKKDQDVSKYLENIESFRKSKEEKSDKPSDEGIIDESILKVLTEYEEHRLKTNTKEGKGIYLAKAVFEILSFDKSLEELINLIKSKGELISTLPTSANVPEGSIGFNLLFGSEKQISELKEDIGFDTDVLIPPKTSPAPASTERPQKDYDSLLKSSVTTVRVDIEKLDRILSTISELSLAKGGIKRIGTELMENYGYPPLVIDVHKISQSLERRLAELQLQVLEIRMVPIGQIFSRLAQVIRRYSRGANKKIDILMYGEDTELDKFLAEEIVDPLMHIVRNSIDHGIEPPEIRKGNGKKETGTIILKAFQKGNHVVIEVRDDGSGIDIDKVKKKAIERGLIKADEQLDEKEILNLIFVAGLSTKDVTTEMSGRGVGMDVVKEKISSMGGFADVYTKKSEGTKFTLTLPITLAIIKALIVKVGTERFAIPLTAISETLSLEQREIKTIEGREVYSLRGEMLPMIYVSKAFNLEMKQQEGLFAVVVGLGQRRMGLLVDELIGQHEIVIKSLGDYFKGLQGVAGAAEIGKHEVILVLDVEYFLVEFLTTQQSIINV